MTVKEIFELRKQGRIEEAYEAIRPMYAAHRGRYTTLCMFWTAADVFKLRLDQNRYDEAEKILEALKRMLPNVEAVNKELDTQAAAKATSTPAATSDKLPWEHDKTKQEGSSASAFIASATRRLAKVQKETNAAGKNLSAISALSAGHKTTPHPEERTAAGGSNLPNLPDLAQQETDNPTRQIITRTDLNPGQRIVLACITAHPATPSRRSPPPPASPPKASSATSPPS